MPEPPLPAAVVGQADRNNRNRDLPKRSRKLSVATLKLDERLSVTIEDVEPANWTRVVYKMDILNNPKIYKKHG